MTDPPPPVTATCRSAAAGGARRGRAVAWRRGPDSDGGRHPRHPSPPSDSEPESRIPSQPEGFPSQGSWQTGPESPPPPPPSMLQNQQHLPSHPPPPARAPAPPRFAAARFRFPALDTPDDPDSRRPAGSRTPAPGIPAGSQTPDSALSASGQNSALSAGSRTIPDAGSPPLLDCRVPCPSESAGNRAGPPDPRGARATASHPVGCGHRGSAPSRPVREIGCLQHQLVSLHKALHLTFMPPYYYNAKPWKPLDQMPVRPILR